MSCPFTAHDITAEMIVMQFGNGLHYSYIKVDEVNMVLDDEVSYLNVKSHHTCVSWHLNCDPADIS